MTTPATNTTSTTPTTNASGAAQGSNPPPANPAGGAGVPGTTSPATTPDTTPNGKQGGQEDKGQTTQQGTTALGGDDEAKTQENNDGKAGESEGKPAEGSTEELKLTLPEGMAADSEAVTEFTGIAKELGLKSEGAQKLMDLYIKNSNAILENIRESHGQQVQRWLADAKADKEYGGANYEANVKIAMKAMARFGGPELKAVLNATGLGNNPELIRAFYRAGKAISEDSVASTHSQANGRMSEEQQLEAMYPSMFKQSSAQE